MVDLDEKYITFIKSVIDKYLNDYELFLFGSRAKGNARKYSDIDIAISSSIFSEEIKNKITFELENSTLPYMVDIIDLNNISEIFKNSIKNSMIKL